MLILTVYLCRLKSTARFPCSRAKNQRWASFISSYLHNYHHMYGNCMVSEMEISFPSDRLFKHVAGAAELKWYFYYRNKKKAKNIEGIRTPTTGLQDVAAGFPVLESVRVRICFLHFIHLKAAKSRTFAFYFTSIPLLIFDLLYMHCNLVGCSFIFFSP